MDKWCCRICGYTHEGTEPPEACPWCGAPKQEFVLTECAWDGEKQVDRSELAKAQAQTMPETDATKNVENIFAALGLAHGAYTHHRAQTEASDNPRLNSAFRGLGLGYKNQAAKLLKALKQSVPPAREGFAEILLQLESNLKLAEAALTTFRTFAAETSDHELKQLFDSMARAEAGYAALFRSFRAEITAGTFPVMFYCPACGMEMDFGAGARPEMVRPCPGCGEKYELYLTEGDFRLRQARQKLPE